MTRLDSNVFEPLYRYSPLASEPGSPRGPTGSLAPRRCGPSSVALAAAEALTIVAETHQLRAQFAAGAVQRHARVVRRHSQIGRDSRHRLTFQFHAPNEFRMRRLERGQ